MLPTMSTLTVRLTVADLMKARGMNIVDLAEKAGVTYATAQKLALGSSQIQLATIAKLCEVFNVQPGDLFVLESADQ